MELENVSQDKYISNCFERYYDASLSSFIDILSHNPMNPKFNYIIILT